MKKTLFTILLLSLQNSFSQEATKKITIEKNYEISNYRITNDGSVFLLKGKKVISAKAKDASFEKLDGTTLENVYTYKPEKQFHIIKISEDANTVLFDDSKFISFNKNNINVLNGDGSVKSYEGKDWLPEDFETMHRFIIEDSFIALGYETGRKNFIDKKVKDYKLFTRNLKNFEQKYIDLELPNVETDEDIIKFYLTDVTATNFSLLTKKLNKDNSKNIVSQKYDISVYNLKGEIVQSYGFETNIDEVASRYFLEAYTGGGSYKLISYSSMSSTSGTLKTRYKYVPNSKAYGNIFIDEKEKSIYAYSVIGSKKSKNGSGFLIHKFDYSGNLIWKKEEIIFTKKTHEHITGYATDVKFFSTEKNIGFSISNEGANYIKTFEIDRNKGQIVGTNNYDKMKPYNDGGQYSYMTNNTIFSSDFTLKNDFPNNYVFDVNTVIAYNLSENLKAYINNLVLAKGKYHFTTKFTDNGFILIKGNNKTREYEFNRFKL